MDAPFLSLCIMTYNRAGTLRETLDSFLAQAEAHPDVEVVISDNGSTDDTQEVVRGYCARHPRIRYCRNPVNVQFDGNVIACVENALGEYMAYCSDDDLATPGLIDGLLKDLREVRPIAAYINHTPFFHNNPAETTAPTQPVVRKVFTNPTEFFLYTGMGFLSAIVLKTSEARKYTSKVVRGRSTGHVDIAARVVLGSAGPFLFDGTLTVLARIDYQSGYDPLRYGAMNSSLVYRELQAEGLLTQADVEWHNRKTIRLFLQRLIVSNRLKGAKAVIPASELLKLYGRDPLFYIYAGPLLLIPPTLLRWIALPLRSGLRFRRKWRLKHGKPSALPTHLAPS